MSGSRQTPPLFYPVCQLDHVCRVDAEEDVKDFFLLFLLTERTASFHERCLYSVHLAVVPVFGFRVARIPSDLFRFDPKQFLVHLQIYFLSFFIILLGRKINIPVSHAFIAFIFNTVWYISTTAFSITNLLLVSEPEI